MVTSGLPLSGQPISTYVRTNSPEAAIEVDASQPASYRVPRTVYGTFLEDIGRSIFGGVSAELLDNPSLENYDASLATLARRFSSPEFQYSSKIGLPLPWLPLWEKEDRRYEPRWGGAANSSRYLYLMGLAGREVGIRQSVYLPIERERNYQGVLFAQPTEGSQALMVSFRRHNEPGSILAYTNLQVPEIPGWHKLAFRLSLPAGAVAPLEPVDFAVSIRGDHRLSIDEIRLYPADALEGFNPDVVRLAQALHSSLLRYGGNFTSAYHWQEGIGPMDTRLTMLNPAWGIPEYNLFGTDELMKFAQLIGAQPQIDLNLGSGSVREARKWV
ncbi:MAG: alpha-L-arabinofuranosidase C-terminal domain-containing protein, partial [Terriglobia bacterium]